MHGRSSDKSGGLMTLINKGQKAKKAPIIRILQQKGARAGCRCRILIVAMLNTNDCCYPAPGISIPGFRLSILFTLFSPITVFQDDVAGFGTAFRVHLGIFRFWLSISESMYIDGDKFHCFEFSLPALVFNDSLTQSRHDIPPIPFPIMGGIRCFHGLEQNGPVDKDIEVGQIFPYPHHLITKPGCGIFDLRNGRLLDIGVY